MKCFLWLACCLGVACGVLQAAPPAATASDWGGVGLLQTPTARMAEAGEVGFTLSRTSPYKRYNFTLQPFGWLEAGFRYVDITNRLYGPAIAGSQSYKDKSIDLKLRLLEESRYWPQVAVGTRDIGGTGLFSGEYGVLNKRFGPLDASVGLGWGYLGARGDFGNPLSIITDKFDQRPVATSNVAFAGRFNSSSILRGRTAVFGGLQYQTPYTPLLLKAEYEGNDYQSEPQANNQPQDSSVNLGIVYRVTPGFDVLAAWERGNTAMLGFTLHTNLAQLKPMSRPSEAAPLPLAPTPVASAPVNWQAAANQLESNAGWRVRRLRQRGAELILEGEQQRYRDVAEAMDRTARVLQAHAPADIISFTVEKEDHALRAADWSVGRQDFIVSASGSVSNDAVPYQIAPPALVRADTVHEPDILPVSGGVSLGYRQSVGGPDGFLLYQFSVDGEASWRPRDDLWLTALTSARFWDNYDNFVYTGPSLLPRVRTYIREYLTTSPVTLPRLQINKTWQPGQEVYFMAYGGLLESMYGGVGSEVLYRPFGAGWAVGADINWVRQRAFEQDFNFRDYETVTGHFSLYMDTGFQDVIAKIHAGRYLAKDNGVTLDFSRRFGNGVRMGAFATFTDVSSKQFGEGSFDKGIYISIPFDLMLARSTKSVANVVWNPLTRDGGQRLLRGPDLYGMTAEK